jgi:glycosyltransferase involved in cell wall biosynthesis
LLATPAGVPSDPPRPPPHGSVPGILVPSEDPEALPAALRRWFGDPGLRRRLKAAAGDRRTALDGWETTSRKLAGALEQLILEPRRAA